MKILILAFMLMTTTIFAQTMPPLESGVSQALARWRGANYSDVRYKLSITLEKGAPLMRGDIEISVNLTETGAKNDLILDWRTTQFANDKDKPFANVVSVNGKSTENQNETFTFLRDEHLIVSKPLLKTGENVIKINFASPIKTSGAAITRYVDKEDGAEYVYSLFVPSDASTAFPIFDQPDLKAQFSLTLNIREDWKAISNTFVEKEDHLDVADCNGCTDRRILTFQETKPISTYVFAFAAGYFVEFENTVKPHPSLSNESNKSQGLPTTDSSNLPMKIYVRQSQAEKFKKEAAEVFRLNREGVKFLEGWFDYKFPFPKYDLVLIPEFPFGGMEHAGATFLREDRVIFPTEPTKNDYITRANVIFHEAAHQWFGDTVTMKWFDDLWLKEGFAEFMAYKTLAKVMPEYNAWKIFYERNKQAAYLTDVTRGTTPIYQEIPNLSAAKSAYGNIVYRKAPSFLRQAEFYLGEKEFQTAVRAFLKKHEFANAEWTDLVKEFETASKQDLKDWANVWVKKAGVPIIRMVQGKSVDESITLDVLEQTNALNNNDLWKMRISVVFKWKGHTTRIQNYEFKDKNRIVISGSPNTKYANDNSADYSTFPNYQDYGYGIFLLDEKSRTYVLENMQNEKDDFLRSMMWGSLWDSLRFYELAPEDYVALVIKNINVETDESTIQTLLGRVSTAMNYYITEGGNATVRERVDDGKGGNATVRERVGDDGKGVGDGNSRVSANNTLPDGRVSAGDELAAELEKLLITKIETAPSIGQKITYFRALQSIGSSEQTKRIFKDLLTGKSKLKDIELKTKDKFDLVTRLIVLGDKDALNILAKLEKQYTDDAAKRYAYAARAGIPTAENKLKYWQDFTNNKEISESYIEAAFNVWNTPRHADLTLPYLEKALAELPNLKKNRKIFFINGWLSAFIGGQKSEEALNIINKFLADNPKLDKDLRNKILENTDNLERAVKIRAKYNGK